VRRRLPLREDRRQPGVGHLQLRQRRQLLPDGVRGDHHGGLERGQPVHHLHLRPHLARLLHPHHLHRLLLPGQPRPRHHQRQVQREPGRNGRRLLLRHPQQDRYPIRSPQTMPSSTSSFPKSSSRAKGSSTSPDCPSRRSPSPAKTASYSCPSSDV
jgi:hypothetical protein